MMLTSARHALWMHHVSGAVCIPSVFFFSIPPPKFYISPQTLTSFVESKSLRKKERKESDSDSGEGPKSATWQMACHALTNWATVSLGNSVGELEYLRLSFCIVKASGAEKVWGSPAPHKIATEWGCSQKHRHYYLCPKDSTFLKAFTMDSQWEIVLKALKCYHNYDKYFKCRNITTMEFSNLSKNNPDFWP